MSLNYINFIDVLVELSISEQERKFLKQLSYSAGTYPDFARVLKESPEISANLVEVANQAFGARLTEPITSTEIALSMIGFIPARNYLAAAIIRKKNHGTTPWDDAIKNTLRFALDGETQGGALAPRFFAAGFVYDFVLHALKKKIKDGNVKSNPKFVVDIWAHQLQVCSVAKNIAQRFFPGTEIEQEVCFHALLHDIGKLIFCFMDESSILEQTPNGVRVLPNFPDKEWAEESRKFGLSHDMVGHLAVAQLGFAPDTSWTVLYHHQPFLAGRHGGTVQLYTTIVWLADQLCRYRELHHVSRYYEKMVSGWYRVLSPFLKGVTEVQFISNISRFVI